MARLTLDEFDGQDTSDWARRIATNSRSVVAYMLEFEDSAFLGGAFAGKYALVTISDQRNRPGPSPLKTETQNHNETRTRVANSLSKFPRGICMKAGVDGTHEFISGRHDIATGAPVPLDADKGSSRFFITRNTLGGSATLDHPFHAISRNPDHQIDALDVIRIAREMIASLGAEKAIEALTEVETKIVTAISTYAAHEAPSVPTLERPFLLTVHGNDDASWGRVFASLEDAMAFGDRLEANADASFVYDNLAFTN